MDWKAKPADPSKVFLNRSLEIQILLACNWSCHACDQFSQFTKFQWVKKGTMTLSQIEYFCREMQAGNFYFGRIRLVGGEPTIHPKFCEIVETLHRELVAKGHVGGIQVITNGSHKERVQPIAHLLDKLKTSGEASKQKNHTANLVHTPASLGYEGKRCGQPEYCGWSLNYYGYAPCSSGAGIMHLRDLMDEHGRASLPQVAGTEKTWPKLQELCNNCYHALRDEDKIRCGTGQRAEDVGKNAPSAEAALHIEKWQHGKVPDWPVYGEKQEHPVPA
jgi:hypothetical protein